MDERWCRRIFVPFEPQMDWFTFLAAILSALICGALYLYQRFVGVRNGRLVLITQSVDSPNHVIVAVSFTAGLVTSLLEFPLLDKLVGLTVAVLILKSATELTLRQAPGADVRRNIRTRLDRLMRNIRDAF